MSSWEWRWRNQSPRQRRTQAILATTGCIGLYILSARTTSIVISVGTGLLLIALGLHEIYVAQRYSQMRRVREKGSADNTDSQEMEERDRGPE